uniref:RNA-directed DNA polymerase, eukaryota, reverse transcriptase zinc-binding domain protein n=1 Tax=Tanacetum cinerariifolium TaxID=118510 RepID=A0A6L2P2D6_TANCI|nr:RNA-directed DNA polymerase, eukaryota, reverse transcriptase zinc-binding domain protein [Tanacetum cinerariifolium]
MVYEELLNYFSNANAIFLPYMVSEHSLVVVRFLCSFDKKKKAFRFTNFITERDNFYLLLLLDGRSIRQVNKIASICDNDGNKMEGNLMEEQFVNHFRKFLGANKVISEFSNFEGVFGTKLNQEEAIEIIKEVTNAEIKNAIFNIRDSKAPGPDGYTSTFFKRAWKIVGKDVCFCYKEVFQYWKTSWKSGPSRCCMKINIAKAYATVDWKFLKSALYQFRFHDKMIKWIMVCVTTANFSIYINGKRKGYFQSGRGLRQGDPVSPCLFTLVMEVFTMLTEKNVQHNPKFKYHAGCNELKLTHLCFADDLLVVCNGDVESVQIIKAIYDGVQ